MHPYIPTTEKDEKEMLAEIGLDDISQLFNHIPEELRLNRPLNIESSKSELEVMSEMEALAEKNRELISFRGAGGYDHLVPSYVRHLLLRSEFYTAYTPYQPEISQGTLQAIFEFQTMIAEITGMDVANASMYDGASATAEAAMLATVSQKGDTVVISSTCHTEIIEVVQTYMKFNGKKVVVAPSHDGITDREWLNNNITDDAVAVIVQYPNYFGIIEDFSGLSDLVHEKKALFIMNTDPISLAVLKTPGEFGADIAVGEGQPLGLSLNYGGPYLGFMASTGKQMRKLPGRIVGQTEDVDGKRAFTLTLQAREQHIRREKATSNICSNQALCALAATIYLSGVGKEGLVEIAKQNIEKSYYVYKALLSTGKFTEVSDAPFFREFVLRSTGDTKKLNKELAKRGFLGGEIVKIDGYEDCITFAVTEKRTKQEMDDFVAAVEEIEWEN